MKKLMITALGLGLALGSVSFAQDSTTAPKMDSTTGTTTTKKPKKAKKMKKPATDSSTASSTDKKM